MDKVVVLCMVLGGCLSWAPTNQAAASGPDTCFPLVIAHRGASGYVPEHTLGAYALAITMGTDYIEPDLVMTRDGHLIARHENQLSLTTDVSQRPEFANRYRTQSVDGNQVSGWFSEDFTLAEIKTLGSTELMPNVRPGNTRMNGAFQIPTLQEIIDLVKAMQVSERRVIGIYPEIKHGLHFQRLGLGMERPLVDVLHSNGYVGRNAPVYIQSFEINNLKELRNITNLKLLQLIPISVDRQPFDQSQAGTNVTFGQMATAAGLREIATYAAAVGPDKSHIIPRIATQELGTPTNFVRDAHAAGLLVHPYTFRSENSFLPLEFRSSDNSTAAIGNSSGEMVAFLNTGIDGLFTDQPDILFSIRGLCHSNVYNSSESREQLTKSILLTVFLLHWI